MGYAKRCFQVSNIPKATPIKYYIHVVRWGLPLRNSSRNTKRHYLLSCWNVTAQSGYVINYLTRVRKNMQSYPVHTENALSEYCMWSDTALILHHTHCLSESHRGWAWNAAAHVHVCICWQGVAYLNTAIASADASVLVQMSTESAQTICMHCYKFQTPTDTMYL